MEVTSDKNFSLNCLSFWSYCIFILGSFHFRKALRNALSDAFLITTQVLLTTCSQNVVSRFFEVVNPKITLKIHQNGAFHSYFAFK